MSDARLKELRAELDAIDGRLLELAAERLRLVRAIRSEKDKTGKHLFDRAREQEVYRRAEARAAAIGLDPEAARSLMSALIEASHAAQATPAAGGAPTRRVLILGGRGKMGSLFCRLLGQQGHAIDVIEAGDALDPARVAAADIVMVAVPMSDAERVTAAVAPLCRSDALLCDINSLKEGVCAAMAAAPGEALGLHPMFGPTVRTLARQKIVVCPVKPGRLSGELEGMLGRMGAELIASEPAVHDATMAVVQVLTHFGIMTMGRALAASGFALADTLPFTSPIYRLELAMVGRLFSQKPELYREILLRNPASARMREIYLEQAAELSRVLAAGDRDAFVRLFEEATAYFADFSSEAMELSDHIIETIMSRP